MLNCSPNCAGKFTWQRGPLRSIIDYVIVTEKLSDHIISVSIDEVGVFDIGSDHNTICIQGSMSQEPDTA